MSTYIVIDTVDITDSMVSEANQSVGSIRYSLDGSKALLKFDSPFPDSAKGYVKYDLSEILNYLDTNKASWEDPGP